MAVLFTEDYDLYMERLELCRERIVDICNEDILPGGYGLYFNTVASFLNNLIILGDDLPNKRKSLRDMQKLMLDYTKGDYQTSFLNPTYAVSTIDNKNGGLLSFLYADLTSLTSYYAENDIENITLFLELFIEVYSYLLSEIEEDGNYDFTKDYVVEDIKSMVHSFYLDNSEIFQEKAIIDMVCPENNYVYDILMNADLSSEEYLYRYGLPISDNEIGLWSYVNSLSTEAIQSIASVYVQGFIKGFEASGKDITIKNSVKVEYPIGFEAVAREAVKLFADNNLTAIVARDSVMSFQGAINRKRGTYTTAYNPQFIFDHKNDKGYYFTKDFYKRRLEVTREALKKYKKEANSYGGPAVIEGYGEADFSPIDKKEAYRFTDNQNKWNVEFQSLSGQLINEYIPGDEYSFTIIAFPLPSIVDSVNRSLLPQDMSSDDIYQTIFDETMKINTLDYNLYQEIQQTIIDTLDRGEYVKVTGRRECGNETELLIHLHRLDDPDKQTNFENCVADVNIPVGEVFTSPVLRETNGVLHVKKVYLSDLEYKNLRITIQDGMIVDYSCDNFENDDENKKLIYENILYRHDSLPMGECAIGTNTVAYTMARRYGIEAKLPILIAEKTGPHFAFGDTCYSHAEDLPMYNPDGKECIARDNECSILRKEDMSKAYFNCHTDVTIPYDELDKVSVIASDGNITDIISEGRFVLEGCEKLNEALD